MGKGRRVWAGSLVPLPSLNYHNKFSNFVLFIYQARITKGAEAARYGGTMTKHQTASGHVRGGGRGAETPHLQHLIILAQYLAAKNEP